MSGSIDRLIGVGQRIARAGTGKSGGYRSILIFRSGERAVFVFAFAKSNKANLKAADLKVYCKAASIMLELTGERIATEVEAGRWVMGRGEKR